MYLLTISNSFLDVFYFNDSRILTTLQVLTEEATSRAGSLRTFEGRKLARTLNIYSIVTHPDNDSYLRSLHLLHHH